MEKRGLEIKFCDDLKPHKKYFYTMQQFPENYVVTIDDDVIYPENLLELLWNASIKFPNTIICTWSHTIRFDKNGDFLPYTNWKNIKFEEPEFNLVPIGCGGVLYPPHCLNSEVFNKEKLIKKSLYTDDLWLKTMATINNTKSFDCNIYDIIYFNTFFTKKNGLWKKNVLTTNRNDTSWNNLILEYPILRDKLKKKENNYEN